jgi:hypothetical protein
MGAGERKWLKKSSLSKVVTRSGGAGRIVVEHSPHYHKLECLSLAVANGRGKKKMLKNASFTKLATRLASADRLVVEHSPHYPSWRV